MADLEIRENISRHTYIYSPTEEGYRNFAKKKEELTRKGIGFTDNGSMAISRNADYQRSTGNINNSGNPDYFETNFSNGSNVYPPSEEGYTRFAAKKEELRQKGIGITDNGSNSISRNAGYQAATGNAHNVGSTASSYYAKNFL